MIKQSFTVVPNGLIQSGTVTITADEKTGAVQADEDIFAGVLVFTKEIKSSKQAKIDPKLLLSASIQKGMTLQAGAINLSITDIDPKAKIATIAININDSEDGVQLNGNCHLALGGQYWEMTDMVLSGQVDSESVTLQLTPA